MNFRTIAAGTVFALAAAISVSSASAQATAPANPVQPQPRDPNMPAQQNTVPEKFTPGETTGATGNLSQKLNRSEGVITPPAMDSGMVTRAPVPNPGTTPVIRPPGEPGGNQSVQPK